MEVLTHCYLKSWSSMIIKYLSIFYFSTVIVYPCPVGSIDFQSYNYINCKVPEKKKVYCDAKNKVVYINLSFIVLSWTLFSSWVWPHSLPKNIPKLCFPMYNMRGYWCLFSVSFWHLCFDACILGGAECPQIQTVCAVWAVDQEQALC